MSLIIDVMVNVDVIVNLQFYCFYYFYGEMCNYCRLQGSRPIQKPGGILHEVLFELMSVRVWRQRSCADSHHII